MLDDRFTYNYIKIVVRQQVHDYVFFDDRTKTWLRDALERASRKARHVKAALKAEYGEDAPRPKLVLFSMPPYDCVELKRIKCTMSCGEGRHFYGEPTSRVDECLRCGSPWRAGASSTP